MNSAPLQQAFWDISPEDVVKMTRILENPLDHELWRAIEIALFKAMAVETCNVEMSEVRERIESGELGVMVCEDPGGILTGIAVLTEDDGWVDIPFLWSAGLPSLNALFEGAFEVAKLTGQKGIKWTTANEKAVAYAKRMGHRQRQIEFVKEV